MRTLIQRALSAEVTVEGKTVGKLSRPGLVAFVGITPGDGQEQIDWTVRRLLNQQIFEDGSSALESGAPLLVVSQFTLYGSVRKGRHPSWTYAAKGEVARPVFEKLVADLREAGAEVETGVFGAMMQVSLVNDGPFTLWLAKEPEEFPG